MSESLEEAFAAWTLASPAGDSDGTKTDDKNCLITSALPYVNNVPHLGNIIGSLLSADVFSRYQRLRGLKTLYICGTDEYGTATEIKALQEKTTPELLCIKYYALHKEIYDWFSIEFDHFGRTSTEHQTQICQQMFWQIYKNGYIFEQSVDQMYCEKCSMFLADRYIEGTCPDEACAYADARGDQCDKCSRLINATELKDPKCKICSSTPIVKASKHLFLDLPKMEPVIREWYEEVTSKENSKWTQTARSIASSWLREGLKPRCITRDLKWGTKVPLEGFEDKVFYVWFDAPIGYLSITRCFTENWEDWWKNPSKVELYQFMAKDNVPFHSIIMPGVQLATGDKFTMVNHLIAVEYLNYEDDKFSKSRGVGVFGNDAQSTGIASDVWRFYLVYMRPENQDSSFNWSDLMTKNNTELLNNLGNFMNRALAFLYNNFDATIQPMDLIEEDKNLLVAINGEIKEYIKLMDRVNLRDSLRVLFKISSLGNQAMQASKPWELVKGSDENSKNRAATVVSLLANIAALLALLFSPFIPVTCNTLREQLNLSQVTFTGTSFTQILKPGHKINKVSVTWRGRVLLCLLVCYFDSPQLSLTFLSQPSPLFRRIQSDEITALKEKFAGKKDSTKEKTGKEKANKKKSGKEKTSKENNSNSKVTEPKSKPVE